MYSYPQFLTVYNNFSESYMDGLKLGSANYVIKTTLRFYTRQRVIGIIKYQNTLIVSSGRSTVCYSYAAGLFPIIV